jgi:hypothetical protein
MLLHSVLEGTSVDVRPDDSPDPEIPDAEWKRAIVNRVLASKPGSDKAKFFGTRQGVPSLTQADIEALGVTAALAADLIGARDRVRTRAKRLQAREVRTPREL